MREIASERYRDLTSPTLLDLRDRLVASKAELTRIMRRRRDLEVESRKLERDLRKADTWTGRLRASLGFPVDVASIETQQREVLFELALGDERVEDLHRESRIEYDDTARAWMAHVGPAFDQLARCQKIWDVTHDGGGVHYKSSAAQTIDRRPVWLRRGRLPQLHPDAESLCFGNANGPDLHLLPSMIALVDRETDGVPLSEIALIRFADCTVSVTPTAFQETEGVPSDATVSGHTWRHVNKDGRPDRRFNPNPRIPVCTYGTIVFESATGLHEEYMFSDVHATIAFAETIQGAARVVNDQS